MGPQHRLAWDLELFENPAEHALDTVGDLVDVLLGVRARLADDGEVSRLTPRASNQVWAAVVHGRIVLLESDRTCQSRSRAAVTHSSGYGLDQDWSRLSQNPRPGLAADHRFPRSALRSSRPS